MVYAATSLFRYICDVHGSHMSAIYVVGIRVLQAI
jgi:hypothetical protein